jgi:hypothetical protein
MRNAIVALILVAGSGGPVLAQEPTAWADKLFQGAASHDFGNVPRGAQVSHRFYLTNIYAVDLQIVNIRKSCGCVTVTPAPDFARSGLKSKETSYLDVVMDARKFTGPKAITIYVTVGPEFSSTATLKVRANSRADVVFNPGQVNFGLVSRGQAPTKTIDIEYAGVLDWKIIEVISNSAPFDVTYSSLYRRPGQVGYRVKVTLKRNAPAGQLKHELQLKTNDKVSPLLPVLVEATVQAALSVTPNVAALGRLKVNELKTMRVVVRGTRPFRITGVEGAGGGVTIGVPQRSAQVHYLTVKCKPTTAGAVRRSITILTDLGHESSAQFTVEADVR